MLGPRCSDSVNWVLIFLFWALCSDRGLQLWSPYSQHQTRQQQQSTLVWCCWVVDVVVSVVHAADCGCGAGGDVDAGAGCDSDVTTLTDQHSVAPQHSMETLSSTSRAVTSHHVAAPARVRQDTGGDQSSEIIRMWCWVDTSDVACKYLQDQHLRQNPKSINFMSDLWKMMDEPNHLFPTLLLTVNSRIRNNWQNQLLLFYGEIFCTKWVEKPITVYGDEMKESSKVCPCIYCYEYNQLIVGLSQSS